MTNFRLPTLPDDDLRNLDVGSWAERKYRLVGIYATLFSTSMKSKWDHRVYIDLFAGPGRSRIRETNRIIPASPTIALSVPHPFTRYILCDSDGESFHCLETRCNRDFPDHDVVTIHGDCNSKITEIIDCIPQYGSSSKVLSFCFADPFKVSDLRCSTLEQLSSRFVDFLVLIPAGMDASRNWRQQFSDVKETAIDAFVGTDTWRAEWEKVESTGIPFEVFFTGFFSGRMKEIGYDYGGVDTSVLIRNPDRNQRLYRLGFFSKNERGEYFWREAKKFSADQCELAL